MIATATCSASNERTFDRGVVEDGATLWPANWLRIQIATDSAKKRTLTCSAMGERGEALLRALADAATEGR